MCAQQLPDGRPDVLLKVCWAGDRRTPAHVRKRKPAASQAWPIEMYKTADAGILSLGPKMKVASFFLVEGGLSELYA